MKNRNINILPASFIVINGDMKEIRNHVTDQSPTNIFNYTSTALHTAIIVQYE